MNDLSYFNLGFRSDRVFESFSNVLEGQPYNSNVIEDALAIIKDCLTIENYDSFISNLAGNRGPFISVIAPILWQLYPSKSVNEVVIELRNLVRILCELKNDRADIKEEEIDQVRLFFSNLADISLSNSAEPIISSSPRMTYA